MFMGEYAHNIDKKGRMIIPAKFREELGEKVMLTRGFDGCLSVYTMHQWETILTQLMKLPSNKKDARTYMRAMSSKAAECEIDTQGRILIPASLIKLAQLQKECMVVGVVSYIEIWAKEKWELADEEATTAFEDIAENLTEFLL